MICKPRYNTEAPSLQYTLYFRGSDPYGFPYDCDQMPPALHRYHSIVDNQTQQTWVCVINPALDRARWDKLSESARRIARSARYRTVLPFGMGRRDLDEGLSPEDQKTLELLGLTVHEVRRCAYAIGTALEGELPSPNFVLAWKKLREPTFPPLCIWVEKNK